MRQRVTDRRSPLCGTLSSSPAIRARPFSPRILALQQDRIRIRVANLLSIRKRSQICIVEDHGLGGHPVSRQCLDATIIGLELICRAIVDNAPLIPQVVIVLMIYQIHSHHLFIT